MMKIEKKQEDLYWKKIRAACGETQDKQSDI
jgi:hypothetical protein